VAGFVAATFMRGVPLIHCPTTLLAMVDSSIGGKTGVDLPDGKNLVGAFWQPRLVWADLATLKSLPDRQWRTGVAEMLKYGWIDRRWDVGLDVATVDLKRIRTDLGLLESAVVKAVAAKAGVVARDERETNGERELLNLGHTFGHALETATNYRTYTHGEAISVGMAAAARLAAALGHLDPAGVAEIESTLSHWGLPVRARRKIARGKLMTAMSRDKKNVNGQFRFVVPTREGRARAVEGVPAARVDRTLREVGL
jgi:3-dehydroquinate synthase